jgi:hypothetical protein
MSHACHFFLRSLKKQKIEMDGGVLSAVWRVSEEHRKIVTILKNAPILDFHCAAGKLKWIDEDTSSYNTTHDEATRPRRRRRWKPDAPRSILARFRIGLAQKADLINANFDRHPLSSHAISNGTEWSGKGGRLMSAPAPSKVPC